MVYPAPLIEIVRIVNPGRSFLIARRVALGANTSSASGSPAGEPPRQLEASEKTSLVAPVQICTAAWTGTVAIIRRHASRIFGIGRTDPARTQPPPMRVSSWERATGVGRR